jgi:hypothetical protein
MKASMMNFDALPCWTILGPLDLEKLVHRLGHTEHTISGFSPCAGMTGAE